MLERVLAERGYEGYRQYRIPAMAVTPSGRILAIYDGRPDFDDLPSPVDLVMRFSDDHGMTWSSQSIFSEHHDISGYGDASIIIDPYCGEHGRVLVFSQLTHEAGFFESKAGCDQNDPLISHIHLMISDDDGASWRNRIVTDQLKAPDVQGIFASSGSGIALKSGRLIQTFVLRKNNEISAAIGYSDDHGETWSLGAEISQGNESTATQLHDGALLIHTRSSPFRVVGRSFDEGLTIDSLHLDHQLPDPSCNGSLITVRDGSVIASHNHDSILRRNLVLKRSVDGGETWPEAVLIESDGSAYSTAYELIDGSIGVLYERNGYSEIVFAKVELTEFMETEKVLPAPTSVELKFILRSIRPIKKIAPEMQPTRRVPEVDMGQFHSSVRKEVGASGGDASNEPLCTTEELDRLLGPARPGWHLGDEIRWSGCLINNSDKVITDVKVRTSIGQEVFEVKTLNPGESLNFLDVRHEISEQEIKEGGIRTSFEVSYFEFSMRKMVTSEKFFKI